VKWHLYRCEFVYVVETSAPANFRFGPYWFYDQLVVADPVVRHEVDPGLNSKSSGTSQFKAAAPPASGTARRRRHATIELRRSGATTREPPRGPEAIGRLNMGSSAGFGEGPWSRLRPAPALPVFPES
jgi:hypothetical protein